MTPVIPGSINRTPTGSHRRCDMLIVSKGLQRICDSCGDKINGDKIKNCLDILSEVMQKAKVISASSCIFIK